MPRLIDRDGRALWLGYCANVLPCERLEDLVRSLSELWAEVRERLELRGRMGIGLWLPQPVVERLRKDAEALAGLRVALERSRLACVSLNAFPYGAFHAERVKDAVYRPAWFERARLEYTVAAAEVLAALLPEDEETGSLSTLPLAWRAHADVAGGEALLAGPMVLEAAGRMGEIEARTGKRIRIALEPEPGCVIERMDEAERFFLELCRGHVQSARFDRYLGVCFDCCHQAVLGESIPEALERLHASGVAVCKVHLSAAIEGPIERLRPFAEPRYLHQTVRCDGAARTDDLERALDDPRFRGACVRTHFHVPIHVDTLGPELTTTRNDLEAALDTVLRWEETPHLEVETYTWSVMPEPPRRLAEAIALEMRFVIERLRERGYEPERG